MHRYVPILLVFVGLGPSPVWPQQARVSMPAFEWTRGAPRESSFLNILGIASMPDGSIIVSDKLSNALVRLDRSGKIMRRLQKKGSDPGSFNGPGPIAAWNQVVAVADFASDRVQLLTETLEPVAEFRAAGSIFSLTFDEDGNLWIGALSTTGGETLFKYDREGVELLRRRTQHPAKNVFDAIFHLAGKEQIVLVYATRNAVETWDLQGHPLGSVAISGFPVHQEAQTPPDILFVGCAQDAQGRLALLAGDVGTRPRQEVFSINEQGEIVGLITLPERSSSLQFVGSERVVVVENRKTTVSSYRLSKMP
jgi:sugar lactone lactonase YvrE